ncbi:hypothetical protein GF351_03925 [Candidatus Woesearchaeota archaeon]|nr:hypothetical protein [Candidatus Woesearchaeota archaeon]
MKILAFVDLHGSKKALKKLRDKVKKHSPDIIICAGDLTVFEQNMDLIMSELAKTKKPVLVIPGNHEEGSDVRRSASLFENITDIHKRKHVFKDYIFLGYGGGGFSLVDKEFEALAKKWEKEIRPEDNVVLVTHAPPYKTELDKIMDEHCGNKSIARFIKKVDLNLVVCGHLHENAGKEHKVKKTRIINPGPYGMVLNI